MCVHVFIIVLTFAAAVAAGAAAVWTGRLAYPPPPRRAGSEACRFRGVQVLASILSINRVVDSVLKQKYITMKLRFTYALFSI